jgi:UDP-GlcNAc:undecaprenyl-phosphate/decaprenyl-phosphate GlcNAc-1-phosphate transferase
MSHLLPASAFVFIVCFLLTPLIQQIAERRRLFDHPGDLKVHKSPVPRLGGVAMMASLAMGTMFAPAQWRPATVAIVVLFGVWLTGLVDDLRGAPAILRLCIQVTAGGVLWSGGWRLGWFGNPTLDFIATTVFFAAMVNAMNFLDGMDGVVLSISGVLAAGFIILFAISPGGPSLWLACGALAVCSAMLFYNEPPASIFIGDSGSNLLGALFALLCLDWIRSEPSTHSSLQLLPLVAIPLADAGAAILRRLRSRMSPMSGDRRHFYDLLRSKGWETGRILNVSVLVTSLFVVLSLLSAVGLLNAWIGVAVSAIALLAVALMLGSFVPEQRRSELQAPIPEVGESGD